MISGAGAPLDPDPMRTLLLSLFAIVALAAASRRQRAGFGVDGAQCVVTQASGERLTSADLVGAVFEIADGQGGLLKVRIDAVAKAHERPRRAAAQLQRRRSGDRRLAAAVRPRRLWPSHGRRVVNDGRALALEISKIAQYAALARYGIRVPHTIAAVGRDAIVDAAKTMRGRFITKHNRAGKGLGVRLFDDVDALARYVDGDEFEDSVDGITLIQQYIEAPEPFITRVEFVGGEFLYAVRVDTSLGFELCPADVCQVGDAFCPVGETGAARPPRRGFASSTDSRTRSSSAIAASSRTTASASRASSSSPTATASSTRTTSTRTRTTTATPSATPAFRHAARSRPTSATSCARSTGSRHARARGRLDGSRKSAHRRGAMSDGGRTSPTTEDNGCTF